MSWLCLLVLTLLWCGGARAQTDTTRPAITFNSAEGTTTFTDLPSPLRGKVFDVGGMGSVSIVLRRQHRADGAVESWNGTSWSSGVYVWNAPLLGVAADQTRIWKPDVTWPGGANLPNGRYEFSVTAVDKAGNSSTIVRPLLIGPTDTTAPALNIVAPADNTLLDSARETLTSINGTASDAGGSGVAYVQVQLSRRWQGVASGEIESWDGTAWTLRGNNYYFATTLSAPNAAGTNNWSLTTQLPPRAQLTTGEYQITVLATDKSGNRSVARNNLHVAPLDTIAPTVNVTFPAEGQQLYGLPEIRGTAADVGSGVSDLRVTLQRVLPGANAPQYWGGASWNASSSYSDILPSHLDFGWTRNQNLPMGADLAPGQYKVVAVALDRYYNNTRIERNFSIIAVPPLSIDAHLRADASQPWLGEGFSNADATGQTLEGASASGETQTRQIRIVRHGGSASKTVRVTIPDWANYAVAGWSARFTDAQSGADITAQITSAAGWRTVMNDGDAQQFTVYAKAPTNVIAGQTRALTFRVEADPTSETPALDVVKATWRVTAPAPDLAIRADDSDWLGQNTVNEDGAGQTLVRIADSSHVVRGQIKLSVADAQNGQAVTWSVPNWDAFSAQGWQARFFDTTNGGNEITGQITNEGWTTTYTDGIEPVIGWEITAPVSESDVTRVLSVRAQVAGGASDVVKASVRALPSVQPDLSIRALESDFWAGEGTLNSTGAGQTLTSILKAASTSVYAVNLKNAGTHASTFALQLPASSNGWKATLFDALEAGKAVTPDAQGNWTSPLIEAGATLSLRLEIAAPTGSQIEANAAARNGKFELRAVNGSLSDVVAVAAASQSVAKILWSRDGQTWNDPAQTPLTVERYEAIAFRAVGSNPDVAWDDMPGFEPTWSSQGETHWGETVWIHFPVVGATSVGAACGTSKNVAIVVTEDR